MAAYELQSWTPFSVCVIKRLPITKSAEQVTGLLWMARVWQSNVYLLMLWISMLQFLAFPHVVLISHNDRWFDFPVLLKWSWTINSQWCTSLRKVNWKHSIFTTRFWSTVLLNALSKMHCCCLGRNKQENCLH